jgi:branched-chain amino acid transport system substrate-binding protein
VLPRIAAANPDAVFLAGYETEGYVLLPEMREAGILATFMASDGCFLYDFVDGSGKWAEGAYVSGITPDPRAVTDQAWWKEYQRLENRNPGTYSIAGYSAMTVLAEGAARAKSLRAADIELVLRSIDLKTLAGDIRFDAKGDLVDQRVYVFQVRDSEFVQVSPVAK